MFEHEETLMKLFELRHGDMGRNFEAVPYYNDNDSNELLGIACYKDGEPCWYNSCLDLQLWFTGKHLELLEIINEHINK